MQSKYLGTGHSDTTKQYSFLNFLSEWAVHQHRDSLALYISNHSMLQYFSIAKNQSVGRTRYELMEVFHVLSLENDSALRSYSLFQNEQTRNTIKCTSLSNRPEISIKSNCTFLKFLVQSDCRLPKASYFLTRGAHLFVCPPIEHYASYKMRGSWRRVAFYLDVQCCR